MSSDSVPVSRESFAAFIVEALNGETDDADWQRFMVAHYADQEMESIRRQCVRVIACQSNGNSALVPVEEINHLRAAAAALTD